MTKVQSQRCIGYQRIYGGTMVSVIETVWEDGRITYSRSYTDLNGRYTTTIDFPTRPWIDVPA